MVFGGWKRASLLLAMMVFGMLGIFVSGGSFKLLWNRASAMDSLQNFALA